MNEIAHYGVKGMRWGVRKERPTSGKKGGKTNAQRIYEGVTRKRDTSKASPKPVKRRVSDMSDEEIRRAISRMQMERTYSKLTANEIRKGMDFVTEVLYNSTKSVATKATMAATQKLLKRFLTGF